MKYRLRQAQHDRSDGVEVRDVDDGPILPDGPRKRPEDKVEEGHH